MEAQELAGGELLVEEGPVGDEAEGGLGRLGLAGRGRGRRSSTRPEVGFSSPAIMRMVVVLPAPFGPRKPWISPGATSRLTPSTAREASRSA